MTDETPLSASELRALAEAGIDLAGPPGDPTGASQVALGLERAREMYVQALSPQEAAVRLKASPAAMEELIENGAVATIDGPDGPRMSAWQFVGNALVPGTAKVVRAAGDLHPLSLAGFMTHPNADLKIQGTMLTPLEWVSRGKSVRRVIDLVEGLAYAG